MPAASFLQALYLTTFSQPSYDRDLYRAVKRTKPRKIVEFGVGDTSRANRLIQLAKRYRRNERIEYTGIDLFEASLQKSISLKQAHHQLSRTGVSVRLVPGELEPALARTANDLVGTDLIVIGVGHSAEDLERASFYIPRMLHPGTKLARYEGQGSERRLTWLTAESFPAAKRRAA